MDSVMPIHADGERARLCAWLTSESCACLLATGCGAGSGKRTRDAIGVSLPIGSHYV